MKKTILIFLVLLFVTIPAFSMTIYLGATAEAMYSFYLPYDFSAWLQGFWGKARFPLGGNVLLAFDPLPFAIEAGGGYYPEVNIGLDHNDNSSPFYVEALAFYDSSWNEESPDVRVFSGGGVGVFLGEMPVMDVIGESKWIWTPMNHLYLSLSMRIGATFDLVAASDNIAMGFVQMGLGVKTGVGLVF